MIASTALMPVGLDLDGSLTSQTRLISDLCELSPLRRFEDDLRLFANASGLSALKSALTQLPLDRPLLTFMGSGDFHHVSLALLEQLPCRAPFSLILIDNHPDWFFEKPTYHCGNWVSGALALPWLAELCLVGQNSDDFRPHRWFVSPFHELMHNRIHFHPLYRRSFRTYGRWASKTACHGQRHWWGTELNVSPLRDGCAGDAWIDRVISPFAGRDVYISIDKDVLHTDYACTDWEQGELHLDELIALLTALRRKCHIIGADVCGEHAASPLSGWWKRLDAGRCFSHPRADEKGLATNEKANLAIMHALLAGGD